MEIGSSFNISQSAMMDDLNRIDKIAQNIASDDGSDVDNLIVNITEMQIAQNHFEANAKVITTMDDVLESILGMV